MKDFNLCRRALCWAAIAAILCLPAWAQNAGPSDDRAAQQQEETDPHAFSGATAEKLMSTIAQGLIGHNPDKLLSAFDAAQMTDYSAFADQVRTFFELYENFRVHYQILNVTTTKCGKDVVGTAKVDLTIEGDDAHNQVPGVTRSGQIRLTCRFGRDGWRVTDTNRGFFR